LAIAAQVVLVTPGLVVVFTQDQGEDFIRGQVAVSTQGQEVVSIPALVAACMLVLVEGFIQDQAAAFILGQVVASIQDHQALIVTLIKDHGVRVSQAPPKMRGFDKIALTVRETEYNAFL
jgi:hypothetical protein